MERGNLEVLLEEKLIKLLQTSITFDSRNNRNKTYSLLGQASKKRSVEDTNKLIEDIDRQISSFEAESIKTFFRENSSRYNLFKDEIDSFIDSLDKKVQNTDVVEEHENREKEEVNKLIGYVDNSVNKVINDAKENINEEEYNYFTSDNVDNFDESSDKLTRDEIDGFMRKIDDKLAELEAEASALEDRN